MAATVLSHLSQRLADPFTGISLATVCLIIFVVAVVLARRRRPEGMYRQRDEVCHPMHIILLLLIVNILVPDLTAFVPTTTTPVPCFPSILLFLSGQAT